MERTADMRRYFLSAGRMVRLKALLANGHRLNIEDAQWLMDQLTDEREARQEAERKLHEVSMIRVWKNEDGKGFIFADDLRRVFGIGVPS